MKLHYIVGPYRATSPCGVAFNIARAEKAGEALTAAGYHVVVPHTMTRNIDPANRMGDRYWLDLTLNLMLRCDAIVLLPDWERSQGSIAEEKAAFDVGIPAFDFHELITDEEVLAIWRD